MRVNAPYGKFASPGSRQQVGHGDPADFVPSEHYGDKVVFEIGVAPSISRLLALPERLAMDFHKPAV